METVVIEDDKPNDTPAPIDIIDLEEESDDVIEVINVEENDNSDIDEIQKHQNDGIREFIEKCIATDSSMAMVRVVRKTLVPLFKANGGRFNSSFDSQKFDRALTKALVNMEIDPLHKYSHIKELCEVLKQLKQKKKIPLTAVPKKDKVTNKKRKKRANDRSHRKKPRIDSNVINLDEEFEVPIVNLNENDINVNGKENTTTNIVSSNNSNKSIEKHFIEIEVSDMISNTEQLHAESRNGMPNYVETVSSSTECMLENNIATPTSSEENPNEINFQTVYSNSLLEVARTSAVVTSSYLDTNIPYETTCSSTVLFPNDCTAVTEPGEQDITKEICSIEKQIESYKKLVDEYNIKEVTDDSNHSPYVQCEFFQKKIVELYDRLCSLQGFPSVKRRHVRLRAIDSRPELPMKKLENLINTNIGKDGLPHFPDFEEVVDCVREANVEGDLGWDCNRITHEARMLFVHCGRALQRKRQRREWRDLLRLVEGKSLEDPADKDPELQARLNMNSVIAKSKEFDIFEKYTNITTNPLIETTSYNQTSQNNDIVIEENSNIYAGNISVEANGYTCTHVSENHNVNNEDGNEIQIKITSVYSCNQAVGSVPLGTEVISDNNSNVLSDSKTEQQEEHNELNSNEMANSDNMNLNNPEDLNCNTVNNFVTVTENKNIDEHNEILAIMKKSSLIKVISIETYDDFEVNNYQEDITNVLNNGNESASNKEADKIIDDRVNQTEMQSSQLHTIKSEENGNSLTIDQLEHTNRHHNIAVETYNFETNDNKEIAPYTEENQTESHTTIVQQIQFEENNNSQTTKSFPDRQIDADKKSFITNSNQEKASNNIESNEESSIEKCLSQVTQAELEEVDSNVATQQIIEFQDGTNVETREMNQEDVETHTATVVKSEYNTIRALEEMGDNFTMTILGIIDPFLVIEISSDSSSDEEDDKQDLSENSKMLPSANHNEN